MDLAGLSCQRCRKFKRKCSRELPTCDRCHHLGAECTYPQRKKREAHIAITRGDNNSPALIEDSHVTPLVGRSSLLASLSSDTQLASQTTGLVLLDVFFSQFIPSSFIFQEARIRSLYLQGQVHTSVLHAIFALASLFLGHAQTPAKWRLSDISDHSQNIRHHGQEWANNASHLVSLHLNTPSLDTVRTLSNLTTYWFGVGQKGRSQASANMVIQAAKDLQHQSSKLPKAQTRSLRWYCFWADLMCRCFVLDDSFAASNQNFDISDITATSHSLASMGADDTDNLSISLKAQPTLGQEALLKTLDLWREARSFIRNLRVFHSFAPEADPAARWSTLFALDSKVTSCHSSLPTEIRTLHGGRLYESSEAPELLLSLHAVYHQCRALPHLAMFMFLQRNASASPEYSHLCSQIAVRHLNLFADVTTTFMSLTPSSASSNPPFVAYCAFLTASIHLACLSIFQGPARGFPQVSAYGLDLLRKRALSSLLLLQHLKLYWSSCKELLDRLNPLCFSASISMADVETHGQVLHSISTFVPSTMIHGDTESATRTPGHDDLELAMIRHLPHILQIIDLDHPAYFSFLNLQPSNLNECDPLSPDRFAYLSQETRSEIEPERTDICLPGTQSTYHQPPVARSASTNRHKARTWIPARPVACEHMETGDCTLFL